MVLIDVENKIQDAIFNALTEAFPGIAVYGEAVEQSATFPAATVWETDNRPFRQSETDMTVENHAVVTYEINAYSDLMNGAKLQAKAIIAKADEVMLSLGFRRLLRRRIANLDRTIYRMYARYEAVVSQPYEENGNTVYKINRR